MKLLYSILLLCISFTVHSQKVGINKPNPAQSLDVNGNANIDGNIMINATSGQPGQALMTNNSGATVWQSPCNLKNIRTYLTSGSFTIPAGVTELFVEVWSAGGGGASGGGGGGGGYAAGYLTVGAATAANFSVGVGGSGATTSSSNGLTGSGSSLTLNGQTIAVNGGSGGSAAKGGKGGGVTSVVVDYMFVDGQSGTSTAHSYEQRTSTQYVTSVIYGKGGNAAQVSSTGGNGAFHSFDTNTPATTIKSFDATIPGIPGGGGGAGFYFSDYGTAGGNGMVVIRY